MTGADLLEDGCYAQPIGPVCDCCNRIVDFVRGSMWHGEHRICLACFYVWYDSGCEGPAAIKAYVLNAEATGKWPFAKPGLA